MPRSSWCLLLAVAASACSMLSPTEPSDTSPSASPVVNYTAVGASDAIGYGSSVACLPFSDCPNGKGYVQVLAGRLKSDGKTVKLLNLGLPGGVLGPELQALGKQVGADILTNFLDNEMPFVASDSTVVTVFAGGNDVNTVARAVRAGLGGADPVGFVTSKRQGFGRDARTLVGGIKARAAGVRVVVLNLPNLAALPYNAGLSATEKRVMQEIAVGFSAELNGLTSAGALVVDLMCDGSFYQAGLYSSDGFHPNDAGYARMAEVAYSAVSSGVAAAPKASCSQMSLY